IAAAAMVKPPQRVRNSDLSLRSALRRTSRRVSIPVPGRGGSWFPFVRPSRSDHQSVFPCTLRFPVREFLPTELFFCVGRAPSPASLLHTVRCGTLYIFFTNLSSRAKSFRESGRRSREICIFKLFPLPLTLRSSPAGSKRSHLHSASLPFSLATCTALASRLPASRLSRCGLPASEN